jgi:DNA-binding NtrC family response regulator
MDQARVLIVDDDETARKNLSRLLQREGFDVSTAKDGAAALARLAEHSYDLVMTDLVMEDMSGLDILATLKTQYPDTQVILITGNASIQTAVEAIK